MISQPDCSAGLPPRRAAVRIGPTRLSYLEWGAEGRALLLLHGITSSARGWWRVAPALAARGYRVYALDMPGHGESDEVDDYRVEALAELVGAAMRAIGLASATMIGHSWGGATALALASSAGGRGLVERVALEDPALQMGLPRAAQVLPGFLEGVGDPPERTLPWLRERNPDWYECDFLWKAEALVQCRAAAVRAVFVGGEGWNLPAGVGAVDVPLLLLAADPRYTVILPEAQAIATRSLRPGLGRMLTIPGTTHNMHRGPAGFEATLAALGAWLAETEPNRL